MESAHEVNEHKAIALTRIPAFPPVAIRVLHLLSDEEVAVSRLLELLEADPAFSAELLRRANSPLFGFDSRIASVQHALVILGLRRTKALAMTVATGMYMKQVMQVEEFRKFWRYSLACAFLCEEIARGCGLPEEMAYTAGLLHDVGRLGLMVAFPDEYSALLREMNQKLEAGEPFDLLREELNRFGIDHHEAGRTLAKDWNLPEELHAVVGRYSEDDGTPEHYFVGMIRLGCRLAYALGFGVIRLPEAPKLEEVLASLPGQLKNRLPADPQLLQDAIENRIRSLDIQGVGLPFAEPPEESPRQDAHAPAGEDPIPAEVEPLSQAPTPEDEVVEEPAIRIRVEDMMMFLVASAAFVFLFLFLLFRLFPQ